MLVIAFIVVVVVVVIGIEAVQPFCHYDSMQISGGHRMNGLGPVDYDYDYRFAEYEYGLAADF